jgi:hypothetical protein
MVIRIKWSEIQGGDPSIPPFSLRCKVTIKMEWEETKPIYNMEFFFVLFFSMTASLLEGLVCLEHEGD